MFKKVVLFLFAAICSLSGVAQDTTRIIIDTNIIKVGNITVYKKANGYVVKRRNNIASDSSESVWTIIRKLKDYTSKEDTTTVYIDSNIIRIGKIVIHQKTTNFLISPQSKINEDSIRVYAIDPKNTGDHNRRNTTNVFTLELEGKKKSKRIIITNFLMLDIGFNNLSDRSNYALPSISGPNGYFPDGTANMLDLNNGKSINVNLWFFMQRINIIKHVVNLKYGLGIEMNNFRYQKNIRYYSDPRDFIARDADIDNFEKNKLVTQYITLPVMLHFNFNPKKKEPLGFSAGMSAGYLYGARQKLVSAERGKEKIRNAFNLNPWRVAAIGELNLGPVTVYGSYALTPLHRNGLDQTPYSIGLRLGEL